MSLVSIQHISPEDLQLVEQLIAITPSFANFTPPGLLDPNYVPPNRGDAIIGINIALTAIALLAVSLRLYTRVTLKDSKLAVDDYIIMPVLLLAVAQCVMTVLDVKNGGAGKHIYDLTIPQLIELTKYDFILVQLYDTMTCLIKISLLFFLRRIFKHSLLRDWCFYILFAFFVSLWIANFFGFFFECHPAAVSWDLREFAAHKGGKCIKRSVGVFMYSVLYAVSDVILVGLPLFGVRKLQMTPKRKMGVMFMFALGILSCIFCIWRSAYIYQVLENPDASWTLTYVLILNSLEVNIAITVSSMPALNLLRRHVFAQSSGKGSSSDRSRSGKSEKVFAFSGASSDKQLKSELSTI